jgi:multidrug efflux pump
MFSKFFIDRPIFASVLSIVVTLAGLLAYNSLPVAQYPDITPPTVEVSGFYPGANSEVVVATVASPIEQQVNGVENMLYMSSQCTNDGTYTLTVTFKLGVDLNMAQVLVQNRVSLAEPILPDLVKRRGVTVKKKSPSTLMIVNLFSPDNSRDNLYLSNYATIQLRDELARLAGVGDITYLGQRDYSMRVWLDPGKMSYRGLTSSDVAGAIEQQNVQVAAGQIGQPPVDRDQVFQYTMSTKGRLTDPEEFADIVLKSDIDGRIVRLRDVARIELGAQGYDQTCTLDRRPSVALSIYQRPGSNALQTADRVQSKMEELKSRFPSGLDYAIVYDTTPFITESVNEVYKTLRDAIILVAVVVLLFLQNWRSALIPLVAVPVAIIGTLAAMALLGFGLNNLTLFGLVLAIGIVVDDAIVVVEAVEHHIEHGMAPRDATVRAMEEVSGPVIAIGLVLTAVFVPCAFISGIVGQFFRQFALTIAVSTIISTFNSLTLSPALAALLLRPRIQGRRTEALPRLAYLLAASYLGYAYLTPRLEPYMASSFIARPWATQVVAGLLGSLGGWIVGPWVDRLISGFFGLFNAAFKLATSIYGKIVGGLLRVSVLVLIGYGGLLYLTYWGFTQTPSGFIPSQDKGYLLVNVRMPDATSVENTQKVMSRIEEIASKQDGVSHTVAIAGQSLLLNANAPNFGSMYVMLDEFHHRTVKGLSGDVIAAQLRTSLESEINEGLIDVFGAPPVEGLGTAGGFKVVIEDRNDAGLKILQEETDRVVGEGTKTEGLAGLFSSFRANTPWLYLDINRDRVKMMGVSMSEVFNTLQIYLGSLYVNDFNRFGRTWQVNVQGDANFRKQIQDLQQLKIRNDVGGMVPFGAMATIREKPGPVLIMRYNMYPSAAINGNPSPGTSSGQAIGIMNEVVAKNITQSMRPEWTELALLQLENSSTAMLVFLLAVILVFLVLAAQYESWSLPLAVILVVPMCLLCSIAGVQWANMDINIFTQVGFVVLVGLACKNAILIVEFAKAQRDKGVPRYEATLEAVTLRLRPIMMTSFAFILGVVPLVLSEGAGAEMRRTLGTAVFSGMLGVTFFGIFLTPVFYYVIQWFSDIRTGPDQLQVAPASIEASQPTLDGTNGHARENGHSHGNGHSPDH